MQKLRSLLMAGGAMSAHRETGLWIAGGLGLLLILHAPHQQWVQSATYQIIQCPTPGALTERHDCRANGTAGPKAEAIVNADNQVVLVVVGKGRARWVMDNCSVVDPQNWVCLLPNKAAWGAGQRPEIEMGVDRGRFYSVAANGNASSSLGWWEEKAYGAGVLGLARAQGFSRTRPFSLL